MKKYLYNLIIALIFLVGLAILLYPSISNWWNERLMSQVVTSYEETVRTTDTDTLSQELLKAEAYNEKLASLPHPFTSESAKDAYDSTLNIGGDGVMGHLIVDRIHIDLPVYHGTENTVLSRAAGHLTGSSLPVGGVNTHTVISAHRGLPRAKLFSDLHKLREGDRFVLKVLGRTLTYEVDQIRVVLPKEIGELRIQEGEDYCTLVTCTPYGINTHRMLVRGHRVPNEAISPFVTPDAYDIDSLILAPFIAGLLLLIVYLILHLKGRQERRRKIKLAVLSGRLTLLPKRKQEKIKLKT